ncbi:MAG: O-antigen ligase family protein, partial [Actinomycetota bacterium]|nr:O-antigen ligase family protein [Actinomycetota bacterium]
TGGSLAGAVMVAVMTVYSMQLACAVVLVGTVVVVFRSSRTAGLIALWLLWLASPFIRRVFGLVDGYISADPLALAPFAATAGVALLELSRVELSRRVRGVLVVALLGLSLGIPASVANPEAGLFALAAYASAVLCLVLGYGEGAETASAFTLRRALIIATPVIAVYGILQYFLPLSNWDQTWVDTVELASIGAPEEGHIRVFSTLNSPGTLAIVLALAVLLIVHAERMSAKQSVILVLLLTCLALTFVRSAVVGLVCGLIGLGIATRGRATPRIVGLLVAAALAVVVLSAFSSTGDAVIDRVATLGSLEDDVSAEERVETPIALLPEAATSPFGHGLGSAGEATKLTASGGLRSIDNAYLTLMWQLGPVGMLLLAGAVVAAFGMVARARMVAAEPLEQKGLLISGLVLLLVLALGVDIFYGVSGAIFWYLLGKALWLAESAPAPSAAAYPESMGARLPTIALPAPATGVIRAPGPSRRLPRRSLPAPGPTLALAVVIVLGGVLGFSLARAGNDEPQAARAAAAEPARLREARDRALALRATGGALERLDAGRAIARRRLAAARTRRAQSAAARGLWRQYRAAAGAVPKASRDTARVAATLEDLAQAYGRLSRSARLGSRRGYVVAGQAVRRREAGLQRAILQLYRTRR